MTTPRNCTTCDATRDPVAHAAPFRTAEPTLAPFWSRTRVGCCRLTSSSASAGCAPDSTRVPAPAGSSASLAVTPARPPTRTGSATVTSGCEPAAGAAAGCRALQTRRDLVVMYPPRSHRVLDPHGCKMRTNAEAYFGETLPPLGP